MDSISEGRHLLRVETARATMVLEATKATAFSLTAWDVLDMSLVILDMAMDVLDIPSDMAMDVFDMAFAVLRIDLSMLLLI